MLKKKITIAIYFALIIVTCVVTLIINGFSAPQDQNSEYASKITLNCPREITLPVNVEISFMDNAIKTEPASLINKVTYSVYTKAQGTDPNDLIIINNTITCSKVGFYYIKFEVPKSKNYNLTEVLVVHVVNTTDLITQNKSSMIVDDETSLTEMFSISNSLNDITVSTNDNINYDNEKFTALNKGVGEITITAISHYLKYKFDFSLSIVEREEIPTPSDPICPPVEEPEIPDDPEIPEDPDTPDVPIEPEEPDKPIEPDEPDEPTNPEEPEDPTDPENPENPNDPDNPVEPENPDTPVNPNEPEDPDDPIEPEQPTDPETPKEPELPDEPVEPDNPPIEEPDDPIVPQDTYMIIIKDENNAVIGDEITYEKDNYTLCINCYVKLGDNEDVEQKFIVEIENEEIATVFIVTEPLIYIICNETGDTSIKITYELDKSVTKTIILHII